jgi:acyl-CoA reductase-like NAD-dependent aldehyde dehydrogenase
MHLKEVASSIRLKFELFFFLNEAVGNALSDQLADLMSRDHQHLAALETYNSGKTVKDAWIDVHVSIGCLRYNAGWADKIQGQTIPAGQNLFFSNFTS